MSAGAFTLTRYQLDDESTVVPIRVQPETLALTIDGTANAATTDAVTLSVSAKARKGTREYGIGARSVTISWNGSPPDDYKDENLSIPVLTVASFNAYDVGDTGTYLGTACTVVSKKSEQLR